jgi:WD40 repeat protein
MLRVLAVVFLVALFIRAPLAANFSRDIAPILVSECLACHNAEKAKGGYRVHNYAAALTAGKSNKPAVVPGQPDQSELFERLVTHDEDDRMPQDDEPLSTEQIALFREWISAGAPLDRGETNSPLALLIPRPNHPAPPQYYTRPLPILALAFTHDGTQIASSGHHEILFWNHSGNLLNRVTNAPPRIHSIAFHPAVSNLFAIAGGKPGRAGELSIFKDGSFLTNLIQHNDELLTAAFSPNGELLAAGGSDNAIRIFATTNWALLTTIQQHADWLTSLQFDSNGNKLLSASRDRTARIYDARTGELEVTYPDHSAALLTAVFITDDRVASAGREKAIHLWEIKEGKKRNEISGAKEEITDLLAYENSLFAASADKTIRQYNISDRKLVRTLSGHSSPVFSLAYHPGSMTLASASFDGSVRIWNLEDGTLVSTFTAAPLLSKTAP